MNSKIFIGDSREILPLLELTEQIALVVTSPPYYVGRGYEDYIKSESEYWSIIDAVFSGLANLVEPFGKIAINFADKYANARDYGRSLEICYVPNYISIMDRLGFDLFARIIWSKDTIPDGARHVTSKYTRFTGQMRICPDWEYIFVWRKRSKGKVIKKKVTMTNDDWKTWHKGIWRINHVPRNPITDVTKLALFPDELPHRLINMYTEIGNIVLDPFAGTGTTIRVARRLSRVGIGIEKNPDMLEILRYNLRPDMFVDGEVEFNVL